MPHRFHVDHPSPEASPDAVRALRSVPPWDEQDRLSHWLSVCLGAAATPRTRLLGRRLFLAAIARTVDPGCEVDHVVVLVEQPGGTAVADRCMDALTLLVEGRAPFSIATPGGSVLSPFEVLADLDSLYGVALSRVLDAACSPVLVERKPFTPPVERPRTTVPVGVVLHPATPHAAVYDSRRVVPVNVQDGDAHRLAAWGPQLWAQALSAHRDGETWLNAERL